MLEQYTTFFLASAGAAAALIGLLFVALSVDADLNKESRIKQFALAEAAFIALGGIFIVSLLALIPSGVRLMAIASILFSLGSLWRILSRIRGTDRRGTRDALEPAEVWYIVANASIFAAFISLCVWITATNTLHMMNVFCVLIVMLFGISIVRAWLAFLINKRPSTRAST